MDTVRTHAFPTPEPVEVDIDNPTGHVRITGAGRGEARVELTPLQGNGATRQAVEQATVEFTDGRLRVHCPDGRHRGREIGVAVTVPDGSSVRVRTGSADVGVYGRVDSLEVDTGSGDVSVEDVDGEATVRTGSGGVSVRTVAADMRVRIASGDLRLEQAGTLHATLASGNVTVSEVGGPSEVRTVSGDLDIGRVSQGDLTLATVSGDVRVGVAEGALAHLTMSSVSGSVDNELPVEDGPPSGGASVNVNARTISGSIRIRRASTARQH